MLNRVIRTVWSTLGQIKFNIKKRMRIYPLRYSGGEKMGDRISFQAKEIKNLVKIIYRIEKGVGIASFIHAMLQVMKLGQERHIFNVGVPVKVIPGTEERCLPQSQCPEEQRQAANIEYNTFYKFHSFTIKWQGRFNQSGSQSRILNQKNDSSATPFSPVLSLFTVST
jgi:hypothetical protein